MNVPLLNLRKPGGFTLIELLVVISIIAMLATIGVAGGQIVIRKARELQAKAQMKGLEIAIKGYKTEYLRLPSADSNNLTEDNQPYDTAGEDGKNLMDVILAVNPLRNPRQIRFWEPPAAKGDAGYTPDAGLRDPWGKHGYMIVLDYSNDGRIVNPYTSETEADELTADVILYCAGANTTFEESGSTSGKRIDDVRSWQ